MTTQLFPPVRDLATNRAEVKSIAQLTVMLYLVKYRAPGTMITTTALTPEDALAGWYVCNWREGANTAHNDGHINEGGIDGVLTWNPQGGDTIVGIIPVEFCGIRTIRDAGAALPEDASVRYTQATYQPQMTGPRGKKFLFTAQVVDPSNTTPAKRDAVLDMVFGAAANDWRAVSCTYKLTPVDQEQPREIVECANGND